MKKQILIAVVGAAMLCSCVPSLNPFYTAKDATFGDRLVGTWQERDSAQPQIWQFEHDAGKTCKLTVTEPPGKRGELTAQLFKLDENYFLDVIPRSCDYATNQAGIVSAAMFPGHLLLRVTQFEPELQIAGCNYDWLEKYLKNNPDALAHRYENDQILLTDSTKHLQAFVRKHLNEMFNPPGALIRK
jgi:hypothetical protein